MAEPHATGRPFPKGTSGNPGGRPRAIVKLRELARQHAPAAIAELARIALSGDSDAIRVAAIRELLDRGYGKPVQAITGEGGEGPVPHRVELVLVSASGERRLMPLRAVA